MVVVVPVSVVPVRPVSVEPLLVRVVVNPVQSPLHGVASSSSVSSSSLGWYTGEVLQAISNNSARGRRIPSSKAASAGSTLSAVGPSR